MILFPNPVWSDEADDIIKSYMPTAKSKGKGGGSVRLPPQKPPLQRIEQSMAAQAELSRQALYRRYAKIRRATIYNDLTREQTRRQTLGPG